MTSIRDKIYKVASTLQAGMFSIILLALVTAPIYQCTFNTEFKMGGTSTDRFESLTIKGLELVFDQNAKNPAACEFRITHNNKLFFFRTDSKNNQEKNLVEICAKLRVGDTSQFRVIQSPNSSYDRILWHPNEFSGNYHVLGTLRDKVIGSN